MALWNVIGRIDDISKLVFNVNTHCFFMHQFRRFLTFILGIISRMMNAAASCLHIAD